MIPNSGLQAFGTFFAQSIAYATQWILYTNVFTPTLDTVLSDLTEASFAGYARAPNGINNAVSVADGIAKTTPFTPLVFVNTDVVVAELQGYALVDLAYTTLYAIATLGPVYLYPNGQLVLLPTYTVQELIVIMAESWSPKKTHWKRLPQPPVPTPRSPGR